MGQIRFQVGTPKAGSAARSAEGEPRTTSLSSLAGSAARAAEEAKRAESTGFKGAPTISMRAAGGKVFQPQGEGAALAALRTDAAGRAVSVPVAVPMESINAVRGEKQASHVSAMTQAEESSQPGALQTAVSRVQSLVQSLFGGRPRTP